MAYVKNWLHCVWGTKERIPFLQGRMKSDLIAHIRENAKKNGIHLDFINGYNDHLHCLIRLSPDQKLSQVIQFIKGESSYWINKTGASKTKFEWATEYYAASVSEKDLETVRSYIRNQEEHHRKRGWEEELDAFLILNGIIKQQG